MGAVDLGKKDKLFAIYRDGVFYGAVRIHPDEEQRRVLALMEAGKKAGSEISIKEAPTIHFELALYRLRTGNPKAN